MRIHILGVGGTFMAGVARLAMQCGHEVTGSDMTLYPPMSTQLRDQGILVHHGYEPAHIPADVDYVIVGNVIKRGNPAMEYVMANQIPYTSGPEWLYDHVLQHRTVLAVSGTHGKTTTTSMLTWLLDQAGYNPGFLIGGVPENFGVSARLGAGPYFVIEADEYDSAFFDKRSKFLHYRPNILIINNLEYDHADIFPDLAAIKQQFHQLVRTVPGNGQIIYPADDLNIHDVIQKGCWTPTTSFGSGTPYFVGGERSGGSEFDVVFDDDCLTVKWPLLGKHNMQNALAALLALKAVGGNLSKGVLDFATFQNVKRRLEVKGVVHGVTVYDDFAHHPTAIAATLAALRTKIESSSRLIAVVEFGSYTMRSGVHKETLHTVFDCADEVICKLPTPDWGVSDVLSKLTQPAKAFTTVSAIIDELKNTLKPNDHVLIMSNGAFDGIHEKLLKELA